MIHTNKKSQSRREVQKRFQPGTYVVRDREKDLLLLVGWHQTPEEKTARGYVWRPKGWNALCIHNECLKPINWERLRDFHTLEEWESLNSE